jgi:two-component system, response regulator YesN
MSITDYNFDDALAAAYDYSVATETPSFVIDNKGNPIDRSDPCDFCIMARECLTGTLNCRQVHLYGVYQAERFGGKYIYFCPASLIHWASPIVVNEMMYGGIIGGPALMIEPEEVLEEIREKHGIDPGKLGRLEDTLRSLPRISPERVGSLAQLLMIVSLSIAGNGTVGLTRERYSLDQQSRISEYIHHIKTMEGDTRNGSEYPIEKERELLRLITTGDKVGAQKILNEILGSVFFAGGYDFELVKSRVLELIVLLSRAALEGGADVEQIFGLNYRFLQQIHQFRTIEDLAFWLSRILLRFTDCVFDLREVKHADAIYKTIHLVNTRYSEKLTLEYVANEVYLSPAYFSKIFKEEMRCNFNTYLNRIRIDQSKILLKESKIPLVDVAGMVGYEDQSYFSKVFKKVTGVTPGKYRDTRGIRLGINPEIHKN